MLRPWKKKVKNCKEFGHTFIKPINKNIDILNENTINLDERVKEIESKDFLNKKELGEVMSNL